MLREGAGLVLPMLADAAGVRLDVGTPANDGQFLTNERFGQRLLCQPAPLPSLLSEKNPPVVGATTPWTGAL